MNAGFILLYRQITEWEWYQNPNTFRLFLHILLKANFSDGRFEGREVKRGQLVTSLPKLSVQTKLSIQQVRTALRHLISTGEITDEGTSQYRVITVVKYDQYQSDNRQNNSQSTDDQQTINSQSTDDQQQYKNNNNGIKEKGKNDDMIIFPADEDFHKIQEDHDRVLDAAEDAGFKMSNNVRASLIDLYAEHGLDKVLEGLRSCSDYGGLNLAYLKAVLKSDGKKPEKAQKSGVKEVVAQKYTQRSYEEEQEDAYNRMLNAMRQGTG